MEVTSQMLRREAYTLADSSLIITLCKMNVSSMSLLGGDT